MHFKAEHRIRGIQLADFERLYFDEAFNGQPQRRRKGDPGHHDGLQPGHARAGHAALPGGGRARHPLR